MRIFTIPNFITLGNLLCGCLGIMFVFESDLKMASYCIFIALVLDFFDGFVARLLKSASEIGKELDSLADVVSFGVLPAFMLFSILKNTQQIFEYQHFSALILALASALRLAKFNIDTRQSDSFIGVPTPANGMIIAALPFIISDGGLFADICNNSYVLFAYTLIMSYLLNSELPLFALKFKDFTWANNNFKFVFILFSLTLLVFFKISALPIIILSYILLSVFMNLKKGV
jgi:CDP-diacylglycerol---serine O-phosphatidyltransferase